MDIVQGLCVVGVTLMAFIGLVWLREQILHGGGPEWLEHEIAEENAAVAAAAIVSAEEACWKKESEELETLFQ